MIEPTIEPYASGSWESTNPIPGTSLYRSLEFKPAASFLPDQNYKIRLSNVLPAIGLNYNSQEVIIPFKTTDLPKIISASTDSEEPLPACQDLEFGFDQGILNIKKASLRLEPNADLDLQLSQNKKTLIAKPTDCLKQGQSYSIKISTSVPIDDQADPKLVAKKYQPFTYEKKFLTKPAPATSLKAPLGTARVDIKVISLEFSEPMQKEPLLDLIDIQPNLKGNWEWQDDQTLKFNLDQNLRYGEKYEVTVNGRAYSINGSFVEGLSLTFNTFGVAAINSFYPSNNQSQVPINQSIKINFNQEVDKEKAQAAFNINPPAEGSFNWQGTSMIFYPQFLQQDTFYTVNLSAGIGSINGLPSNRSYQTSFRTVESQTILNVPYDHQDYPLSCEASALKMALGYYGLNPSEDEIMGFIGHNGPLNRDEAANIWGNPNLGYVGDVNGSQNSTGYGVHWGPIAKAANNYRPAQAFSGWSASQLASEIEAGHPVVIWGSIGGNPDSWNDESGNQVYAWKESILGQSPASRARQVTRLDFIPTILWEDLIKNGLRAHF